MPHAVPVWARSGPRGRLRTRGPLGAVLDFQKATSQPGSRPSLRSLLSLGCDLISSFLPGRWLGLKGERKVPFIGTAVAFGEPCPPVVLCGPSQFVSSARRVALGRLETSMSLPSRNGRHPEQSLFHCPQTLPPERWPGIRRRGVRSQWGRGQGRFQQDPAWSWPQRVRLGPGEVEEGGGQRSA